MKTFVSIASPAGKISFPQFSGIRVMMMPFMANDLSTIPETLKEYRDIIMSMIKQAPKHIQYLATHPCYLTIDERFVEEGKIQRNPGLHIDGMYNGEVGGIWSSGTGSWGSAGNGMLVASNIDHSLDVYVGAFTGYPVEDGDCEHLRDQLPNCHKISPKAGEVVWADGFCVHEALPMKKSFIRQFIRLTLPNGGVWFNDYTHNPNGVLPAGRILPARIESQRKKYGKLQ